MAFLNKDQIKKLKEKDWKVTSNCAFINLFRDDFASDDSWEQVCDQLKVSTAVDEVTVLYVGVLK